MANTSISDRQSFHEEARWQRVCAACGRPGGRPDFRGRTWHAHHVIPRRLLRRLGEPQFDTRGALRLCTDCHYCFENFGPARHPITVRSLTDQNICYIWQVLGVTVVQIERMYGDFDSEPRWHLHRMGECPICQLQLT